MFDISNYRPISKLCLFVKIFEKIIYGDILGLVINKTITQQHKFFPKLSMETNLIAFVNFLHDSMNNQHIRFSER